MNTAEDAEHYFLLCPKYNTARPDLLAVFGNLGIPCTTQVILHGSLDFNFEINQILFDSIHHYIKQSNRF